MIVLIVTLCVAGQPKMCHQERLYPPHGVTQSGCFARAQPALAARLAEEPGYVIRKWRCEDTDIEKVPT